MVAVKNKIELKKLLPTHEHIYVESLNQIYKLEGTEFIQKAYFTTIDLCRMMSIKPFQLYAIMQHLKVDYKMSSSKAGYKFKLKDIRKLFAYHLANKKAA